MKRRVVLRTLGGIASGSIIVGAASGARDDRSGKAPRRDDCEPYDPGQNCPGTPEPTPTPDQDCYYDWPMKYADAYVHENGEEMATVSLEDIYEEDGGFVGIGDDWEGPSDVYRMKDVDDSEAVEEVVMFVHGYNQEASGAADFAKHNAAALRDTGWDHRDDDKEFICVRWDSDQDVEVPGTALTDQNQLGRESGKNIASFIDDYRCEKPNDVTIRLIGHSMGTQVVVSTLHHVNEPVDHATLLASNIDVDRFTSWGYDAVEKGARELDTYHNPNDGVLSDWTTDDETGEEGLPESTPSNITDHNVNDITGDNDSGHNYHNSRKVTRHIIGEWETNSNEE